VKKLVIPLALVLAGIVAAGLYGFTWQVRAAERIVEDGVCACHVGEHEASDADVTRVTQADTIGPRLSAPVKLRRSYRINCSSVDAGSTVADCLIPVDGGVTVGPASSVYVAPTAGSSVKVRVGSADVTSATGFEVGTGARDGVGVTVDAAGCWCKSEGAAQAADVVVAQ